MRTFANCHTQNEEKHSKGQDIHSNKNSNDQECPTHPRSAVCFILVLAASARQTKITRALVYVRHATASFCTILRTYTIVLRVPTTSINAVAQFHPVQFRSPKCVGRMAGDVRANTRVTRDEAPVLPRLVAITTHVTTVSIAGPCNAAAWHALWAFAVVEALVASTYTFCEKKVCMDVSLKHTLTHNHPSSDPHSLWRGSAGQHMYCFQLLSPFRHDNEVKYG